jgi:hypothetical protein
MPAQRRRDSITTEEVPSMLHPELARLQEQYNAVLDEHEAGNLSYDEALMTVQVMSVLDGGGYVWMIDPVSGAFLRAVPGEQPIEADPSQFMPAQIPAPGSSPWASQQDLLRPPSSPTPIPQYDDTFDPRYATAPGMQPVDENPYQHLGRHRGAPAHDDPRPRRERPSFQPDKVLAMLRNIPLPPVIARNKRMAAIVVGVALFVIIAVGRGGDTPEAPSVAPVASTPATVAPGTDTPAPTPGVAVPNVDQRMAVFVELISGDRVRVSAQIAAPGDARTVALQTARLYGYREQTNLKLKFAAEPTVNDGVVVSEVQLLDRATDEVYATTTVTWTLGPDQRWRLTTYPVFE